MTHGSTITETFNNLPDENVLLFIRKFEKQVQFQPARFWYHIAYAKALGDVVKMAVDVQNSLAGYTMDYKQLTIWLIENYTHADTNEKALFKFIYKPVTGATFDEIYCEFEKQRSSLQGYPLPDSVLKAIFKTKIDQRVATALAAKPESYVWSFMDYVTHARQRSHVQVSHAGGSHGAAMAPMYEQVVDEDDFYAYQQLAPFAAPSKETYGKNKREGYKKTNGPRPEPWSPEWVALYSNAREQQRECRYCRESSRDSQGNITHTILECGKLWINVQLTNSNGVMPAPANFPQFVKDYLATEKGSEWFKRKTSPDVHGKKASLGAMSLSTAQTESFANLLQCHECFDEDFDKYNGGLSSLALAPLIQDLSPTTCTRTSKTDKTVNFNDDLQQTASYMNAHGFSSSLPAVEQSSDMLTGLTPTQLAAADITELVNSPTESSLVPLALKPLAEWDTVKKLKTSILVHRLNAHGITVHAKHTKTNGMLQELWETAWDAQRTPIDKRRTAAPEPDNTDIRPPPTEVPVQLRGGSTSATTKVTLASQLTIRAYWDSGAAITAINSVLIAKHPDVFADYLASNAVPTVVCSVSGEPLHATESIIDIPMTADSWNGLLTANVMPLSNAYDIIIGRDSMRRYGASLNFDAANNDFISLSGGITLAALQVSEPALGCYDIAALNPNRYSEPAIGSYDIAALSPDRYSDHDVNKDNTENFSSLNSFSWADEMDKFTLQARQRSRLVDTRLDLGGV